MFWFLAPLALVVLLFVPSFGLKDFLPAETLDGVAIFMAALILEQQSRLRNKLEGLERRL